MSSAKSKTCSNTEHSKVEKKSQEKGASVFILKERFSKTKLADPVASMNLEEVTESEEVDNDDTETFEVSERGDITIKVIPPAGTIGVDDDSNIPEPCPSKPPS